MNAAASELPGVEKKLQRAKSELNELTKSLTDFQHKTINDTEAINQVINKLDELKQNISQEPNQFNDSQQLNEKITKLKEETELLQNQRIMLEKQLSAAESTKHELRILEDQRKKIDISAELSRLEIELNAVNSKAGSDEMRDLAGLKRKESQMNSNSLKLNNQIQQKTGEQMQLRKKIDELKRQLNDPRFFESKQLYAGKMVERAVVASTIEDLEKYYKIVDDSIIAIHQQKMEQINIILRDLWVRVYQGNDIETIKIKSQPVSGGEKKKSYDYSVVMTVDQRDIDMRDRCSAGQKVLASILIRIALADVFAANCPVLALDEPTTNLDVNKVENVAAMLKSLIDLRTRHCGVGALGASQLYALDEDFEDDDFRSVSQSCIGNGNETMDCSTSTRIFPTNKTPVSQKVTLARSLQLIVITHDKHLVDSLYQACRPEYIYVLSKDEYGVSQCRQYAYNNDWSNDIKPLC